MPDTSIHWKGRPHHRFPKIRLPSSRATSFPVYSNSKTPAVQTFDAPSSPKPIQEGKKNKFSLRFLRRKKHSSGSASSAFRAKKRASQRARQDIQASVWKASLAELASKDTRATVVVPAARSKQQSGRGADQPKQITTTSCTSLLRNVSPAKHADEVPVTWVAKGRTNQSLRQEARLNSISPYRQLVARTNQSNPLQAVPERPVGHSYRRLDRNQTYDPRLVVRNRVSKHRTSKSNLDNPGTPRVSTTSEISRISKAGKGSDCGDSTYWGAVNSTPLRARSLVQSVLSDSVSRTTSDNKALNRFIRELDHHLQKVSSTAKETLIASASASSTSAHTVLMLKPYQAEFEKAGLAVTSAEQKGLLESRLQRLPPTPPKDKKWLQQSNPRPSNMTPRQGKNVTGSPQKAKVPSVASYSTGSDVIRFTPPYEKSTARVIPQKGKTPIEESKTKSSAQKRKQPSVATTSTRTDIITFAPQEGEITARDTLQKGMALGAGGKSNNSGHTPRRPSDATASTTTDIISFTPVHEKIIGSKNKRSDALAPLIVKAPLPGTRSTQSPSPKKSLPWLRKRSSLVETFPVYNKDATTDSGTDNMSADTHNWNTSPTGYTGPSSSNFKDRGKPPETPLKDQPRYPGDYPSEQRRTHTKKADGPPTISSHHKNINEIQPLHIIPPQRPVKDYADASSQANTPRHTILRASQIEGGNTLPQEGIGINYNRAQFASEPLAGTLSKYLQAAPVAWVGVNQFTQTESEELLANHSFRGPTLPSEDRTQWRAPQEGLNHSYQPSRPRTCSQCFVIENGSVVRTALKRVESLPGITQRPIAAAASENVVVSPGMPKPIGSVAPLSEDFTKGEPIADPMKKHPAPKLMPTIPPRPRHKTSKRRANSKPLPGLPSQHAGTPTAPTTSPTLENTSDTSTISSDHISHKQVFLGLHVATAAACDTELDRWIQEKTGQSARQFLSDLSAFEVLGVKTLASVAKRAAKQKRENVRAQRAWGDGAGIA